MARPSRVLIGGDVVGTALRSVWQLPVSDEIDPEYGTHQIVTACLEAHLMTDHNHAILMASKELSSILKINSDWGRDRIAEDIAGFLQYSEYYELYEEIKYLIRNKRFESISIELKLGCKLLVLME